MPKGRSLHVGINHVDPAHYGEVDPLHVAEQDAIVMEGIAQGAHFETEHRIGPAANTTDVLDAIGAVAADLKAGDIFLFTYSGHGSQVPDKNGDEDDARDETLCLFDRMLVDDELRAAWHEFKSGVRILVIADSCHSGTIAEALLFADIEKVADLKEETVSRLLGEQQSAKIYEDHKALYDGIQESTAAAVQQPMKASVIELAACADGEEAVEGPFGGAFTTALRLTWSNGDFLGDYETFIDVIAGSIGQPQTPQLTNPGTPNSVFKAQKPFTI
jgi:hypothetical protein